MKDMNSYLKYKLRPNQAKPFPPPAKDDNLAV